MDLSLFLSTFGLLFLAELGDKTQLAVIAQTCRYRRPHAVFWGASMALAVVTALGVLAGQVVGRFVPLIWVQRLAALGFVAMGLLLGWQAWRPGSRPREEGCSAGEPSPAPTDPTRRAFGATFGLLFLAEMGDKTQLAVFTQASHAVSPWAVLGGATVALVGVTALGVICGQGLLCIIPERWLRRLAAVAFVLMGVLIGLGVL